LYPWISIFSWRDLDLGLIRRGKLRCSTGGCILVRQRTSTRCRKSQSLRCVRKACPASLVPAHCPLLGRSRRPFLFVTVHVYPSRYSSWQTESRPTPGIWHFLLRSNQLHKVSNRSAQPDGRSDDLGSNLTTNLTSKLTSNLTSTLASSLQHHLL
jgi:hypothetical protein